MGLDGHDSFYRLLVEFLKKKGCRSPAAGQPRRPKFSYCELNRTRLIMIGSFEATVKWGRTVSNMKFCRISSLDDIMGARAPLCPKSITDGEIRDL